MTTKQYLGQIRKLNDIIRYRTKEIRELKEMAGSVSSPPFDKDKIVSSGGKNQLENKVTKIVDLERQVEAFVNLKYKIIEQLESLERDEYNVLYLRYVEDLPFTIIYSRLNRNDIWSESRVYKAHKQGLENFEVKYGVTYL